VKGAKERQSQGEEGQVRGETNRYQVARYLRAYHCDMIPDEGGVVSDIR
jgi:hypothetical protein